MKRLLFALLFAASSAQAGWIEYAEAYVSPQDPGTIETWLEGLTGADLTLTGFQDLYDGGLLIDLTPGYIVTHYGGPKTVHSTVAWVCSADCSTFDPPNTWQGYGISNERDFLTPRNNVPEPSTLLLALGGIMALRLRRG